MENYTPKILEDDKYKTYAEMLVELDKCGICAKSMMPRLGYHKAPFPKYLRINQDVQMKNAGFVYSSGIRVDDHEICIECKDAGKATILCSLCNERKNSDKKKESYGDPPEYLCTDCYGSVPAKTWDEKAEQLYEDHKYDFD